MGRPRRTLSQGPWQGGKAGRGARARDREASGSPAPLETGAPAGAPSPDPTEPSSGGPDRGHAGCCARRSSSWATRTGTHDGATLGERPCYVALASRLWASHRRQALS